MTRTIFWAAWSVVLGAMIPSSASAGPVYDAAGDFSAGSNPGGVWGYGYAASLNDPFTLFTTQGTVSGNSNVIAWQGPDPAFSDLYPFVGKNVSASSQTVGSGFISLAPGQMIVHPGPSGALGVVRFTSPISGTFALNVSWEGLDSRGTTTDVHVLLNGTSLFDGEVTGTGSASARSYGTTLTLGGGDTVDFVVGFGSNGTFNADSTAFTATLTAVPEPSSLALIATGGVAALAFAVRRRSRTADRS